MVTRSSSVGSMHILMRRSSATSRPTRSRGTPTSRSRGRVKQRALPEVRGSGSKPSDVKKLSPIFTIAFASVFFVCERLRDVDRRLSLVGLDEVEDVLPLLRPHVAEQARGDRAGLRGTLSAVALAELARDVAVELVVERLHLLPEPLDVGLELVGRACRSPTRHMLATSAKPISRAPSLASSTYFTKGCRWGAPSHTNGSTLR